MLVRGGGDLASGVALRLHRSGYRVVICEVPQPLAVRRAVSYAEAIYQGSVEVEGIRADIIQGEDEAVSVLRKDRIAILVDPEAQVRNRMGFAAIIDGRMLKRPSELAASATPFIVGLGPGFVVGEDCHAVVETKRGHFLGRVYWEGSALANTGIPDTVSGFDVQRVIRAPADGILREGLAIGSLVRAGERIALVDDQPVTANFSGALRGLLHDGIRVSQGFKIGDLDPRADPAYCFTVSDKALAVAGGVLEALFTREIFPTGSAG